MGKISVKINGNDFVFADELSVSSLLDERKVTGTMFVVEKNLQIVQKEDYACTVVKDGDVVEIVGFFGGG